MGIVTIDFCAATVSSYRQEYGDRLVGNSFTTGAFVGKITSCKYKLMQTGTITGNCYAKLYSHSGTYGTSSLPNALLATSDPIDVETLSNAFLTEQIFTFSGAAQVDLTASTNYCIVFTYAGGDSSNYVRFGYEANDVHGGNHFYNGTAYATADAYFYVYGDDGIYGSVEFTGAGDMSADGLVTVYGSVEFTGAGDMSAAGVVTRGINFLKPPKVTTRMAFATHVIVNSPTNTGTANITPEPAAAARIYRLINIDSGDAALCSAVAAELITRWGKDQVSVKGDIPLDVQLLFMTKVQIIVPEAALNSALILQRKEHDILNSKTNIVCGDIILSDDELLARILDELG